MSVAIRHISVQGSLTIVHEFYQGIVWLNTQRPGQWVSKLPCIQPEVGLFHELFPKVHHRDTKSCANFAYTVGIFLGCAGHTSGTWISDELIFCPRHMLVDWWRRHQNNPRVVSRDLAMGDDFLDVALILV